LDCRYWIDASPFGSFSVFETPGFVDRFYQFLKSNVRYLPKLPPDDRVVALNEQRQVWEGLVRKAQAKVTL
jgi:hypothetical protein